LPDYGGDGLISSGLFLRWIWLRPTRVVLVMHGSCSHLFSCWATEPESSQTVQPYQKVPWLNHGFWGMVKQYGWPWLTMV